MGFEPKSMPLHCTMFYSKEGILEMLNFEIAWEVRVWGTIEKVRQRRKIESRFDLHV